MAGRSAATAPSEPLRNVQTTYDVAVVGLGCHGSSIAAHLSARGLKVLGLEKFEPVHCNGSSHGCSRIFRTAYFEDPSYVPLLKRSLELWKGLNERDIQYRKEQATKLDGDLLTMCGTLTIGPRARLEKQEGIIGGTMKSIMEHKLEHEIISAEEMSSRYPMFTLDPTEVYSQQLSWPIFFVVA